MVRVLPHHPDEVPLQISSAPVRMKPDPMGREMERTHRSRLRPVKAGEPHRPPPAQTPLVYTVAEVAKLLKVSAGTVRNMIDEGQLYAVRLNVRRIVIPKWAVDDLVARPSAVTAIRRPASNA